MKSNLQKSPEYIEKRHTKETLYTKRDLRLHAAVGIVYVGKNREIDVKRDLQKSPVHIKNRLTKETLYIKRDLRLHAAVRV